MDTQIAILGIIEILSALSCGMLILFLTYRIAKIYGLKKLKLEHSNTAYNIMIAAMLFSVGYVVSGVIQPILVSFRLLSKTGISSGELVMKFIVFGSIYIAISYICSMLISIFGVVIYSYMTPMNEAEEIKSNNIGVGLIIGVIMIVLVLMSKDGVMLLIESLIPYPNLPPN